MNRIAALSLATLSLFVGQASAQQATEVYIPIGESPGISSKVSVIGSISNVDHQAYRVTINVAGESKSVTMTSATLYYVDRTGERKQNATGSFEDCQVGLRMEAYVDDEGNAIWVKVEAAE